MSEPTVMTRDDLVTAARQGDEAAFRDLVEPHRRELHVHCYRMSASLDEADDLLQEVMLRAWRGLPRFEGRSSFRTWLYRIATNVCLSALNKQSRRVLPVAQRPADEPLIESAWIEPYPDEALGVDDGLATPEARYEQRESVELAFIAALQHLSANQRAALILRDVLGFTAREVADALGTTTTAINSALQHARTAVQDRVPDQSQQSTLRSLGDERLRAIVAAYATALERGDVDAIVAMLAEDATWSMPPYPEWYQGHRAIQDFLVQGPLTVQWRHIATRANGQLAVSCYVRDPESGDYRAAVIDVLTLRGEQIGAVTAFVDSELFQRFGLPAALPG
jgi:RNA polymerase sigma-70 factor, ECF subfamily